MVCAGTAIFMTGVSSNNVMLDCAGFSITTGARAIRISGANGVTVKNCTIETSNDTAETIRVDSSSSDVLITGNNLTTNGHQARAIR